MSLPGTLSGKCAKTTQHDAGTLLGAGVAYRPLDNSFAADKSWKMALLPESGLNTASSSLPQPAGCWLGRGIGSRRRAGYGSRSGLRAPDSQGVA